MNRNSDYTGSSKALCSSGQQSCSVVGEERPDAASQIAINLLYFGLILAVLVRIFLIYNYQINWDEFFFLSHVYEYVRGDLSKPFQTAYVHLFTWLTFLPGDEIENILVARVVMLLLQIGTVFFLFRIVKKYTSQAAALFAVLSYFCFSYVVTQGTSFRADPIATFFLVACISLLVADRVTTSKLVLVGMLIAISCLVTIKSVFYLPTILVVMICIALNSNDWAKVFPRFVLVSCVAVTAFFLLYLFHELSLGSDVDKPPMNTVANSFINPSQFFPQRYHLFNTIKVDLIGWLVLLIGLLVVLRAMMVTTLRKKWNLLLVLALVFPLVTLVFYRNSFPYFYPFILAPVCILSGVFWVILPWRSSPLVASVLAMTVTGVFLVNLVQNGIVRPVHINLQGQRAMLTMVHRVFPEPVSYIDRNSMVSSFPKAGIFMSTLGMNNYWAEGQPAIRKEIEIKQPRFLLANIDYLDVSRPSYKQDYSSSNGLFEEDVDVLKNNYIPHWGLLYVAGKSFNFGVDDKVKIFEILIQGEYTLESDYPVVIDKNQVVPGSTYYLALGSHEISLSGVQDNVKLRWGKNLYRPRTSIAPKRLYYGF